MADEEKLINNISTLAVDNKICNESSDDLKAEYQLKSADKCPACGFKLAFHQRKIIVQPERLPSSNVSSNAQVAYHYPNQNHYSVPTNTVISNLPKWKVDYKNVKPFLQRYEQVLTAGNIDPSQWKRLLLFAVENVTESSWIKSNIVDRDEVQWQTAKEMFHKHFELHIYAIKLVEDYERCKQMKNESVQNYSDRFSNLCQELSYEDNSKYVIQHYMAGLLPQVLADVKRQLNWSRVTNKGQEIELNSLKQVIELALDLTVTDINYHQPSDKSSNNNNNDKSQSSDTDKSKQYCKYHPQLSSHSTSECNYGKSLSNKAEENKQNNGFQSQQHPVINPQESSSSGNRLLPRSSITLTTNGKPLECHACKGNHYASDPNCPKRKDARQIQTRSTTSSSSPSASATQSQLKVINQQPTPATVIQSRTTTIEPTNNNSFIEETKEEYYDLNISVGAIDRSVTEETVIPQKLNVMLLTQDHVYNSLPDSGATVSFIDETLVNELKLPIEATKTEGNIRMAHANLLAKRIGQVKLNVLALFPGTNRTTINIVHPFEVLPLKEKSKDYHFVIGTDLIPILFPNGIPLAYIPASCYSNGKPSMALPTMSIIAEPRNPSDSDMQIIKKSESNKTQLDEQLNHDVASIPQQSSKVYTSTQTALLHPLKNEIDMSTKFKFYQFLQPLFTFVVRSWFLCWMSRLLLLNPFSTESAIMIKDPNHQAKFKPEYTAQRKPNPKPKQAIDINHSIYEGYKIINHRGSPGYYEYLVDWKGYFEADRSWEPGVNFIDNKIIQSYWGSKQS